MTMVDTVIFYLLFGTAVSAAVYLKTDSLAGGRLLRTTGALFFWPLFVPILLGPARTSGETSPADAIAPAPALDDLTTVIKQVERELDSAIASLDGWAEEVLVHQTDRLSELKAAWKIQAARVREMDRILKELQNAQSIQQSPRDESQSDARQHGLYPEPDDRIEQSESARRENIGRLKEVRNQTHRDLLGTLAWVRELVTMIHLAKFTGAPAARAEELVAQVAAAVEGLSEVTEWTRPRDRIIETAARCTRSR